MKKYFFLIIVLLLWSWPAFAAKDYKVVKPDKVVKTHTQTKVGQNPTKLSKQKAVQIAVKQMKKSLIEAGIKMELPKYTAAVLNSGLNGSTSTYALKKGDKVAAATYGRGVQGWTDIETPTNIVGRSFILDIDKDYAVRVIYAPLCRNIYLQLLKKEKEVVIKKVEPVIAKAETVLPEAKPADEYPELPMDNDLVKGEKRDKFSVNTGAGTYESNKGSHQGSFEWAKFRYRPYEDVWLDKEVQIGGFIFGAMGSGNDNGYKYNWNKEVVGVTGKMYGKHWDTDLDLGIGQLKNEGGKGKYKSNQTDDIISVSAHLNTYERRDEGKKLLPGREFNVEATIPVSTKQKHSWDGNALKPKPNDNRSVELTAQQDLYDFDLGKLRLTPTAKLGLGRDYGQDANFGTYGPGLDFGWNGKKFGSVYAQEKIVEGKKDKQSQIGFSLNYDF